MTYVETLDDCMAVLSQIGWKPGRDEVGGRYASIRIGNIVLEAGVGRRDTRWSGNPDGYLLIEIGGSITTDAISAAYTLLGEQKKRYSNHCIVLQYQTPAIKKATVTDEDIKMSADCMIQWAKSCDINAGLEALKQCKNRSGDMPARHLAALAAAGDVETLSYYQDSFAKGDRLGFVPYITDDYIARALDFAEHRRADPDWLPKTPRMRV